MNEKLISEFDAFMLIAINPVQITVRGFAIKVFKIDNLYVALFYV